MLDGACCGLGGVPTTEFCLFALVGLVGFGVTFCAGGGVGAGVVGGCGSWGLRAREGVVIDDFAAPPCKDDNDLLIVWL